ncbi:MAG: hypothetical protein ACM3XS_01685 [Bacteroidota bacterium]
MSTEELLRRKRAFTGSYFGLLLGWIGILLIAAGVVLGLRELDVFSATRHQLIYWGELALAGTAVLYGLTMFAMTWSFARFLNVNFLPALAFAIWGMIPLCNAIPLVLLLVLAARQAQEPSAGIPA